MILMNNKIQKDKQIYKSQKFLIKKYFLEVYMDLHFIHNFIPKNNLVIFLLEN